MLLKRIMHAHATGISANTADHRCGLEPVYLPAGKVVLKLHQPGLTRQGMLRCSLSAILVMYVPTCRAYMERLLLLLLLLC
jgi:hypothetical protein